MYKKIGDANLDEAHCKIQSKLKRDTINVQMANCQGYEENT